MSRHRSVLEELRPPGGWFATPTPADLAPTADTSATPVDAHRLDELHAEPIVRDESVSETQARAINSRAPEKQAPAPKRRLAQLAANEQRFLREREATRWMQRAACRGCDPALFFPERGEPTAHAKAMCASCPVQPQCLEHALQAGEKFGIWGGLSERERRRIRRERRRAGTAAPTDERLGGAA